MDFNIKSLFEEDVACIAAPTYRNLQLNDPRIVSKYLSALEKQLTYHKLANKAAMLHKKAIDGNFSEQDKEEYKKETSYCLKACYMQNQLVLAPSQGNTNGPPCYY
jgi:hypothetical protein